MKKLSSMKVPDQSVLLVKIAWASVESKGIVESAKILRELAERNLPGLSNRLDVDDGIYITIINAIGTAVDGIDDVASISVMMNTILGE